MPDNALSIKEYHGFLKQAVRCQIFIIPEPPGLPAHSAVKRQRDRDLPAPSSPTKRVLSASINIYLVSMRVSILISVLPVTIISNHSGHNTDITWRFISRFETMGNYAPLFLQIRFSKFTQTEQNTISKGANANLICTLPFRTKVSIYVTLRAGRSYSTREPGTALGVSF